MMEQFSRDNIAFELHYAIRSRSHGAYWQHLIDRYGPRRIKIYVDEEKSYIPVAAITDNQPLGTHLYVCGPAGMIDGVLMTALKAGWPKENLHSERFLAPPAGLPFQVFLEKIRHPHDRWRTPEHSGGGRSPWLRRPLHVPWRRLRPVRNRGLVLRRNAGTQ